MKEECPMHNHFPDGCMNWKDALFDKGNHAGKYDRGECKYDKYEYPNDGYPAIYITTRCCRLGGYKEGDEFTPIKNLTDLVKTFDLWGFIYSKIKDDRWNVSDEQIKDLEFYLLLGLYDKVSKEAKQKFSNSIFQSLIKIGEYEIKVGDKFIQRKGN